MTSVIAKNKLKIVFASVFLILRSANCLSAQDDGGSGVALDIGYAYNQTSMGYVGGALAFNSSVLGRSQGGVRYSFLVGGGGYWGKFAKKSAMFPAGYVSFGIMPSQEALTFELKGTFSKHYINPAIGLSIVNLAKIHVGYSIPCENLNGVNFKGINIGVTLSLGNWGFYGIYID